MNFLKNLFQGYESLIENDKTDYIQAVSKIVKTTEPERFEEVFRQWLIDSVANIYSPNKNTNRKCIVLCGSQGFRKTSFVKLLYPASIYLSELPFFTKEALADLTSSFVIVLDNPKFNELSPREIAMLKNWMLMDKVMFRPKYAKKVGIFERTANFIATSNLKSDDIFEGRFIESFDLVESINMETFSSFDISKMWGQAHKLVMKRLELENRAKTERLQKT